MTQVPFTHWNQSEITPFIIKTRSKTIFIISDFWNTHLKYFPKNKHDNLMLMKELLREDFSL